MLKRIKLYWKNLKESQTMKEALIAKALGAIMIVEANFHYFEASIEPQTYGIILTLFGFLAAYRRGRTTKPLSNK